MPPKGETMPKTVAKNAPKPLTLGQRIYLARTAARLTQAEVARRLGISERTISRWEVGRFGPTPKMAERLLRTFDGIDDAAYRSLAESLGLDPLLRARDAALDAALVRAGELADARPSGLRAAIAHVLEQALAGGVSMKALLARLAPPPPPKP